jgi:integrase
MSKSKATTRAKPREDFPLFKHPRGWWAKKVKGRTVYFGKVADDLEGEKAVNQWLDERDEWLAGRNPRDRKPDALLLRRLCDAFIAHKDDLLHAGELTQRSYDEYHATCQRLVTAFGHNHPVDDLVADDFRRLRAQIAKQWGPVRLANEIQRVRSMFRYGFEAGILDKPIRFGPDFKKPSAKVLRQNRAKAGPRMFEAAELRAIVEAARLNVKAMVLLGINAGLGNADVAALTFSDMDLKTGWLVYPRQKTGIERRIPLWPETVAAIRAARKARHEPKDPAHKPLVFIGARGESYVSTNGYRVAGAFNLAIGAAKIKPRRGFYAIRHTFQTIAEGARDLAAVQSVMGHAPSGSDMSARYRERIDDQRLRAVVDYVYNWLFGEAKQE